MNPEYFPRDLIQILNDQTIDKEIKNKMIETFEKTKSEEEQTKREQEQTKRTWLYIFHKENWVNLNFNSLKTFKLCLFNSLSFSWYV